MGIIHTLPIYQKIYNLLYSEPNNGNEVLGDVSIGHSNVSCAHLCCLVQDYITLNIAKRVKGKI